MQSRRGMISQIKLRGWICHRQASLPNRGTRRGDEWILAVPRKPKWNERSNHKTLAHRLSLYHSFDTPPLRKAPRPHSTLGGWLSITGFPVDWWAGGFPKERPDLLVQERKTLQQRFWDSRWTIPVAVVSRENPAHHATFIAAVAEGEAQ